MRVNIDIVINGYVLIITGVSEATDGQHIANDLIEAKRIAKAAVDEYDPEVNPRR